MLVYDSNHAALYQGDSLEVLQGFPDDSFDLVITSPPYEGLRTYGMKFALWGQDWVDWALVRYLECVRVCRGLVAWVVEGHTHKFQYSATPLLLAADLHRRGVRLRKPPIYRRYGIPGSGGPDWVRNDYEMVICSAKGKLPWNDRLAMGRPPLYGPGGAMSYRNQDGVRKNARGGSFSNRDGHGFTNGGGRGRNADGTHKPTKALGTGENLKGSCKSLPKIANPGNVIQERYTAQEVAALLADQGDVVDCKVGGGVMGSQLCHENEAPFPERIAEFFIKSFCPPNGMVLDICCGSGTSVAAAIKAGRYGVGIDIRESQIDLSKRRIAEAIGVAA